MITSSLYGLISSCSTRSLNRLLEKRKKNGKEDPRRLNERRGKASKTRPNGKLIWIHAASVGETQSAFKIIEKIQSTNDSPYILITTGTKTSAQLVEHRKKDKVIHQYIPLDHPKWTAEFLNHWQPDVALWIESELWPNILQEIKKKNIPACLINARLSKKSYRLWRLAPSITTKMLSTFTKILCQTETDAYFYKKLGASNVSVSGNVKYSASPLPCDKKELEEFNLAIDNKKILLYASTHDGEEQIATDIHKKLKPRFPEILTVIIPRHPERKNDIKETLSKNAPSLKIIFRSDLNLPENNTDIFIADTLGELGLFYRLTNIAFIGRSLSNDGGGGHNPIEAAQLNTAIISGKNTQNLKEIYDNMHANNSIIMVKDAIELQEKIEHLLKSPATTKIYQQKAYDYIASQNNIINNVMNEICPVLCVDNLRD